MNRPLFFLIIPSLFVFFLPSELSAKEERPASSHEYRAGSDAARPAADNPARQTRQNGQPRQTSQARPPIIGGTSSPDFYDEWDPQTRSQVWGVHTEIRKEPETPAPPIYVTPELKWPWPSTKPAPGEPGFRPEPRATE